MSTAIDPQIQRQKLQSALDRFVERLGKDKSVLAAVLVGSFADEVLWRKETIHLWIIEEDGISRRLKSDGNDERLFRTFVEDDVHIHAELIPRSRFKLMVEGSSRTAFSCNFFARRKMVHCTDLSIAGWFAKADELATKDQKRELLAVATWVCHSVHHAHKIIKNTRGTHLLLQDVLWAAHGLAAVEVISRGEVCEGELIERAIALNPALFKVLYQDVVAAAADAKVLEAAVDRAGAVLAEKYSVYMEPLLSFLRKEKRVVPLSEISEFFAHTQLYPGHLEAACEWLARHGHIDRVSAPFRITKKSRVEVEEPAYLLDR